MATVDPDKRGWELLRLMQDRSQHKALKRLQSEFKGNTPIRERGFEFERDIKEPVTAPNVEYVDVPGRQFTAAMRKAENYRRSLFRKGFEVPSYYDLIAEVHRTGKVPPSLIELARKNGI